MSVLPNTHAWEQQEVKWAQQKIKMQNNKVQLKIYKKNNWQHCKRYSTIKDFKLIKKNFWFLNNCYNKNTYQALC